MFKLLRGTGGKLTPSNSADATTPGGAPPRPVDYQDAAKQLMLDKLEEARNNSARKLRDRQDWWNLELQRGGERHWQVWDENAGRFVKRGTDPARGGIPAWVPRAVTNNFAMLIDGIASLLNQTDPAKECGPGSDDDRDRAAAEISQNAIPALLEEMGYVHDRGQLHKAICLTSLAGYIVYCDSDEKYGTDDIPALQCVNPDCQDYSLPADALDAGEKADAVDGSGNPVAACPTCGAPVQDALHPNDPTQPLMVPFAKGKMCGEVVYSFEISLPRGARTTDTRRLPWVAAHRRWSRDDAVARWPQLKDVLDNGVTEGASSSGMSASPYADAMAGLVAPYAGDGLRAASAHGPLVFELWHDPIADDRYNFPQGFYGAMVDGNVVEAGPLQYTDENDRPIKNVLLRQFVQMPGNAAGKPPADDLAPLQVQRNITESMLDLSLMHFASPKEYIPLSVTLLDEPTGAPGERIRYRSSVPGEKPSISAGTAPPAALNQRLESIDAKMQELSKLNAILAGQQVEGHATLGEIQILRERGMSAFREPLDALISFECELARMALRVARKSVWTPRFYKIAGDNGEFEVKQFLGADLDANVEVYIDAAQAWPRSPLMESMQLKELFDMGVFPNPAWQDPELAERLLSEKGMARLKPSSDFDRKQIARILEAWRTATDPSQIVPPDPIIDNVKMHFQAKQAWMKSEDADETKQKYPAVWQAMRAHLQQLQQLQAPPPMAAVPGGGPGAGAGAAAPAGGSTPPGGGSPLKRLLSSGALKPAGKATSPADLVKRGLLTPAAQPAPAPAAGAAQS